MSKTSIKLDGEALKAAKHVMAIQDDLDQRREALQQEYEARIEMLEEEAQSQMNLAWTFMMSLAGVPESDPREWRLDTAYMDDHGLVFLYRPGAEEGGPPLAPSSAFIPPTQTRH